jgi:hypothetical protein
MMLTADTTHIIYKKPHFNGRTMAESTSSPDSRGTKGWSTGTKALVGIVLLILVIATLAVFTLTVAVLESQTGTQFPYTTNYRVTLPDGEPVTIGSSHILVASYDNELFCDVDGTKEKLVVGQQRVISPRHAKVTVLGVPILDTDFQITLTYLGSTGKNANFDMSVKTSTQVPEIVVRRLIPSSMNAQPV